MNTTLQINYTLKSKQPPPQKKIYSTLIDKLKDRQQDQLN